MNKYEPVKVPISQLLKEFRLRILPVIVFFVVLLIVLFLWDYRVYNPSFTGRVYADVAYISSPNTGLITNMHVREFDQVHQGDTLAIIVEVDSAQYASQIALINAQIDYVSSSMEPISGWQRNRINLAELRSDLVDQQLNLSSLNLRRQTENARVQRMQELFRNDLVSQELLDDAKLVLDLINDEIEKTAQFIEILENQVEGLDSDLSGNADAALNAALSVHEAELKAIEQEIKPINILAPFSGMIGKIYLQNGAVAPEGEPFLLLESNTPTHIIGYMRQPLTIRPEIGTVVQVRTRTAEKKLIPATITNIGAQISVIDETVQRPGNLLETGLPVKIEIFDMESVGLMPGEFVDVIVNQRDNN